MIIFLNGQFVPEAQAVIPVNDRGFMYGDGLFETMRVVAGWPFRLAQHLERMTRGADFLKIKPPFTPKELQQFAEQLIEKNQMPEAILRVTLTRGPGERGYTPKAEGRPTVVMMLHAAPSAENPVHWSLITSSFRVLAADPLSSFKTLNKLKHVMARAEAAEKGADEALLINTNGEVAETTSGNLFWVFDDKICTTPTGRGVLPGITRAVVLEICQTLGLLTNKRVIKPEALENSEGIFVTQSALGVVPVATFDGEPVAASPLVDQIFNAYRELLAKP
jgi:branched-chain amino acid aminotransferase